MLLEAGLTLASELSLPIVLQRIVDLAAHITDARYGALGVIGEGDVLVEFITTGVDAQTRRAIGALATGRGVLGLLIHAPRPVRIWNVGHDSQQRRTDQAKPTQPGQSGRHRAAYEIRTDGTEKE